MKLKMQSAATADLTSGMAIRHQMPNSLTPSMRAASSSSSGTLSKNWRMRKMPVAVITPGKAMPQYCQ